MKSNTFGKNSTLNGCANSTVECLFTEALVMNNDNLNVACTAKPKEVLRRYFSY